MEVAGQIVVMNEGRVEQTGQPSDLYEHPQTEFVMSFIGPVNRRGAMFIRPHDLELLHVPAPEAEEAMIERVVNLGFETRVELLLADGEQLWAQMTRDEADLLELVRRPDRLRAAATRQGVRAQRGSRGPRSSPRRPERTPPHRGLRRAQCAHGCPTWFAQRRVAAARWSARRSRRPGWLDGQRSTSRPSFTAAGLGGRASTSPRFPISRSSTTWTSAGSETIHRLDPRSGAGPPMTATWSGRWTPGRPRTASLERS